MASGVKVVMNSAGARALLSGAEMRADIDRRCKAIAERAMSGVSDDPMRNDAYVADDATVIGGRASGSVVTGNPHGIRDNAKRNTLLKSLDAGR